MTTTTQNSDFPRLTKQLEMCERCFRSVLPDRLLYHQATGRCNAHPHSPLTECELCGVSVNNMFQHQRTKKCRRLLERRVIAQAEAEAKEHAASSKAA